MYAQNLDDIVEQVTPLGTFKTLLGTRLRKWLTGKSCTEDVVIRNRRNVQRSDVAVRTQLKVLLVKTRQFFVDLASKDTPVTETCQRLMKAPQSCKQIDEFISLQLCSLSSSWVKRQLKLPVPLLIKEFLQSVTDNILKGERRTMRLRDATQLLVLSHLERHAETLHLRFVRHFGTFIDLRMESC